MCLTDAEFNAIMSAIQYREREYIKEIVEAKKRKLPTQVPEALNRLIEAKYKLYNLKCKPVLDTSKIGLSNACSSQTCQTIEVEK